jgi:hypothetical protein
VGLRRASHNTSGGHERKRKAWLFFLYEDFSANILLYFIPTDCGNVIPDQRELSMFYDNHLAKSQNEC